MAINNLNSGVGIQPTIVDAKGDLIVATGADAVNRLAVGTANQQLVVDSSTSTGLKWAAPSGLVLLNTTSFSGVSSQSVNDVFSATYDNYLIVFDMVTNPSTLANLNFRLRVSSTDASGANYNYITSNKTGSSNPAATSSGGTSINMALVNDTYPNPGFLYLFSPFIARPTGLISRQTSTYSTVYSRLVEGHHTLSTSYTGYTLTIDAGTVSGKVSTYGYNL
jgi:hypothetical protein